MAEKPSEPSVFSSEFKEKMKDFGIDLEETLRFIDQVGKFVKVKTVNREEHLGWMKCLDPLSGNFFLVKLDDTITKVTGISLIMGHACKSSEVLKEPTERVTALLANMDNSIAGISAAMIPDRKERLLAWIKKNRLPVKEREDKTLVVADNVTISPPYEIENCASPNPRTLTSIRQLVEKLPRSIDEEATLAERKKISQSSRKDNKKKLGQENLDQGSRGQGDLDPGSCGQGDMDQESSSQGDFDQERSQQNDSISDTSYEDSTDQENFHKGNLDKKKSCQVDSNTDTSSKDDSDEDSSDQESFQKGNLDEKKSQQVDSTTDTSSEDDSNEESPHLSNSGHNSSIHEDSDEESRHHGNSD